MRSRGRVLRLLDFASQFLDPTKVSARRIIGIDYGTTKVGFALTDYNRRSMRDLRTLRLRNTPGDGENSRTNPFTGSPYLKYLQRRQVDERIEERLRLSIEQRAIARHDCTHVFNWSQAHTWKHLSISLSCFASTMPVGWCLDGPWMHRTGHPRCALTSPSLSGWHRRAEGCSLQWRCVTSTVAR